MTDFRKLALEFVLEDDEAKLANIARRTASEIEAASADTNPVARWVQAVQPWMPGSNDQGPIEVDLETPNWTARTKALDFLSRTLVFLNQDTLKPSQVKLLIAFFGAMFEVDHKAGIMASATALSHIITFKSFQPQSGRDIIRKVCALSEDFSRQVPKTRLAIYELLRSLIADSTVASHLQRNDGPSSSFMVDLLRLFQKERDPECLMVWFDLMSFFLAEFSPSEEVLEAVFGAFKAYFPITLPRTSQSGLTPDTLKIQLRKCFSSCHRLAHLTLPFLLSKLDQGDGVTVGVKIDILRTIRACIEEYSHPDQSVAPHASNLWASLKYEVRNGEVEDTIWATLEALKAVTMMLPPGALREFALTVARECVSDLSDQTYMVAAGRLLISVLSANIHAFVLMVSPIVTHIKENLRHAKSPVHSQNLLKILRIILETRLLFANAQMTDPEMRDFATTDSIFISLYEDVFRSAIQLQNKADASFDDIKISTEAAQGTGALVSQRLVKPLNPKIEQQKLNRELLLPENTCVEVCNALFAIVARSWDIRSRKADYDELINESIVALRRTVEVYPPRFNLLMDQGLTTIRKSYTLNTEESSTVVQRVSSVMAFVGCSNLRPSCESGMRAYFSLTCALTSELLMAMDMRKGTDIWCALVAGIQSAFRYFGDAFQGMSSDATTREQQSLHCEEPVQNTWLSKITKKYPILHSIEPTSNAPDGQSIVVPKLCNISELREDFLLASLFLCRQLYRRVTKPLEDNSVHGKKALCLSEDFNGSDPKAESRFLATLSNLASFIVGEFNRHGSSSLQFDEIFLTLFRDDLISVPSSTGRGANIAAAVNSWSWLAFGPLNVLSLGILKSLLPSSVMRLFTTGVAQEILLSGVSLSFPLESNPIARAILAILANRYEVETLGDLMSAIERALDTTIQQVMTGPSQDNERQGLEKASTLFTLLGGLLRRCTSSRTQALRRALLQAPDGPSANYFLAKGLELIVAPQPFVTDSIGSVQKPLWMQKLYVDIVRPMMDAANGISSQTRSPLVRTNYGIAVLVMVRHMKFPIYEDEAGDIVRICIATSQNLGVGSDTQAALGVIKNIIIDAPSALHDHLQSLINICTSVIARTPTSALQRPAWMPQDYAAVAGDDGQAAAACTSLALEVLGCLLRLFDTSLLLPCAPRVRRELAAACGLDVRDLRSVARYARAAWADLR